MRSQGELKTYLRLHTFIAITGYAIAPLVLIVYLICGLGIPDSISATFYSPAAPYFIGALYVCSAFFIADKGYNTEEDAAFNICGLMFWLIQEFGCNGKYSFIHYASATILFITLGFICYRLFSLNRHAPARYTQNKDIRELVYKSAGITIYICVAVLAVTSYFKIFQHCHLTFFLEWIMLWSFCTAFIVKGTKGKALKIQDE
jgi:hypothetical protein